MPDFVRSTVIYTAVLAAVVLPAVLVARHYGEGRTVRNFALAVPIAGLFCGTMAAISQRLVDQCQAEGNTSCFDYGGDGLITLVIAGFVIASIGKAYLIHTD